MSIEWFRDLVICIFGLMATLAVVLATVVLFLLYRRLRVILDSAGEASKTVQGITAYIKEELVKPTVDLAALIQGIRQGFSCVSKFFHKK